MLYASQTCLLFECQKYLIVRNEKRFLKTISLSSRVVLDFFPVSKNKLKNALIFFKHWNNNNYIYDTRIWQKINIKGIIAFNLVDINLQYYGYCLYILENL